jgi:RNA polymerase sigma-70 factor, ECF subfamily
MVETPASLLERLRRPGSDDAWRRFVRLYTPLLYYWARRLGETPDGASDLVQDVFVILVQQLPVFVHDPRRRFRGWLWTLLRNRWRDRHKRRAAPAQMSEAMLAGVEVDGDEVAAFDEAEYRSHLVSRAFELMQTEFQPSTWKACWEVVVSGRPAQEVAADLGMSVGAVYVARSRVLRRLRDELAGLLD